MQFHYFIRNLQIWYLPLINMVFTRRKHDIYVLFKVYVRRFNDVKKIGKRRRLNIDEIIVFE